jgi:putative transposase
VPRSGEQLDPRSGFEFVKAHQAELPVQKMCRVLELSPSGDYAWLKRLPSERARRDAELVVKIRAVFEGNKQVYGRPRIFADLKEAGEKVGQKRVSRLMKQEGIHGASRRRRGPKTTRRDKDARPAPDLVERNFTTDGPDQLWVADITYIPTWAGFLYLAVVLDAWSRRILGWAMGTHLRTELVLDALNMAIWQRQPRQVILHSDQGTQYTSIAFGLRCREVGVRPSMGSVGDAYDNAMCESFFATLECELLDRHRFTTQAEARYGRLRLRRGPLQPAAQALCARPAVPDQLRAAPRRAGGS